MREYIESITNKRMVETTYLLRTILRTNRCGSNEKQLNYSLLRSTGLAHAITQGTLLTHSPILKDLKPHIIFIIYVNKVKGVI